MLNPTEHTQVPVLIVANAKDNYIHPESNSRYTNHNIVAGSTLAEKATYRTRILCLKERGSVGSFSVTNMFSTGFRQCPFRCPHFSFLI